MKPLNKELKHEPQQLAQLEAYRVWDEANRPAKGQSWRCAQIEYLTWELTDHVEIQTGWDSL